MNLKFPIFLLTALISGIVYSQEKVTDFPELKGPYLGQKPPGLTPEIFAPGIVSIDKYSEFVCIFTPGAEECIFDRYGDDEYPSGAVFVTRIANGTWTEPEIHPLFADFGEVFLPTLSPDGQYWFFTSKTLPIPEGTQKIIPMYYIKKNHMGWTEPEYLTQSIHASMTRDGTVYVNSGREIKSQPDFKAIVDLSESVPFDAGHSVISPDGDYLIFDNRTIPTPGDCKLFVSFKTGDGSWSDPISLGKYIKQHAFCAWITSDGKYIFFHSQDNSKGNIYWVSAEIIEKLRPDDFSRLKGPYFGQEPPGDSPELFMPGLLSTLDVEYCISFLDRGRVCVFGRNDIGVQYTYLKNGQWTEPQKMPLDSEIGEWKHNAGPDDKTLYFMSPRPINPDDTHREMNIYKMEWTGSGWTTQTMLPFPPNSTEYHEIYSSFSSSGTAYFHGGEIRNVQDINDDIYRSRCLNGVYQQQERLPDPISTDYGEYDAFVAPDEEYLMFGSNRPGGFGRYDTYICFQKNDETWTHPVNMGRGLNSISWDNRIMVTPDGKYMFFVSGRKHELLDKELENSKRTSASGFYWVNTAFIQDMKEVILSTESAAGIVSMEYLDQGLQPAISRLSELKNHRENRYHFAPSELLMLCRRMIEAGRVHDSDLFYQALQETLEEDYRIQRGYGMICVMQGLVDKGLALLQESMSDFPVEFMETVYSLGSDLLLKSKTEDALKVMTFNAGHFPDHPMPHYGLARAYQQIGDTERMMMCCEKALEINPDYEPAANLFKLVHK